jgi:5-(carboxyamino)imidazole ribonucleotide synthase
MRNDIAFGPSLRLGVLGGGQLGRMMIQSATDLDLRVEVMDPSPEAPCRHLTHRFVQGDLNDADAVFEFGRELDVVTIEIEHVSVEGLRRLQAAGVTVYPSPDHLAIIQDKGVQKQFFVDHGIPTAAFVLGVGQAGAVEASNTLDFPFVQKLRTGGYDGQGVQLLADAEAAADRVWDEPSVWEQAVDIEKELSVIVARNPSGETATFPVVEAVFDPAANLVDYLIAPADIATEVAEKARSLALKVSDAMAFTGLLAVELFLDRSGALQVNEVAPRTHNSGHHTIEANRTSQFEQHLRAILDLPLGDTAAVHGAGAMLNLVGGPDAFGAPVYEGLGAALTLPGVHPHIYGKSTVKPFRKMGHVTITGSNRQAVLVTLNALKTDLRVSGTNATAP